MNGVKQRWSRHFTKLECCARQTRTTSSNASPAYSLWAKIASRDFWTCIVCWTSLAAPDVTTHFLHPSFWRAIVLHVPSLSRVSLHCMRAVFVFFLEHLQDTAHDVWAIVWNENLLRQNRGAKADNRRVWSKVDKLSKQNHALIVKNVECETHWKEKQSHMETMQKKHKTERDDDKKEPGAQARAQDKSEKALQQQTQTHDKMLLPWKKNTPDGRAKAERRCRTTTGKRRARGLWRTETCKRRGKSVQEELALCKEDLTLHKESRIITNTITNPKFKKCEAQTKARMRKQAWMRKQKARMRTQKARMRTQKARMRTQKNDQDSKGFWKRTFWPTQKRNPCKGSSILEHNKILNEEIHLIEDELTFVKTSFGKRNFVAYKFWWRNGYHATIWIPSFRKKKRMQWLQRKSCNQKRVCNKKVQTFSLKTSEAAVGTDGGCNDTSNLAERLSKLEMAMFPAAYPSFHTNQMQHMYLQIGWWPHNTIHTGTDFCMNLESINYLRQAKKMEITELDDDVLLTILSRCNPADTLPVCRFWSKCTMQILEDKYGQRLTLLMNSLRLKTCPRRRRRFLMRMETPNMCAFPQYKCGICLSWTNAVGGCLICRKRMSRRLFPWKQVVVGPLTTVLCILSFSIVCCKLKF